MKTIGDFYLEIFSFLEVKFSIYLNRHVFVMQCKTPANYENLNRVRSLEAEFKQVPLVQLFCNSS